MRALISFLSLVLLVGPAAAAVPDFERDVMAVLSKSGCNQGTCHGNLNGKGGFKLSLRGEDPAHDFAVLTRESAGRRCDPWQPDQSLVLLKALGAVSHEGARVFAPDSAEYALLRDWIAAGMPASPPRQAAVKQLRVTPGEAVVVEPQAEVQLAVEAVFSDATRRDVTRMAVFESAQPEVASIRGDGRVRRERFGEAAIQVRYLQAQSVARIAFVPARPELRWPDRKVANLVDQHVFARLQTLRMLPAPLCDDSTFLRRVTLDTLGVLPSVEETRAFLADRDPEKRSKYIDRLLQRPEFADHWALKWSDVLRNEEKVLDAKGTRVFHAWIRDQIASDVPVNEFARALVSGRGSTYARPAANFYRVLRDPYARAEAAAQVFLGIRVQCARCHSHPYDRWTQDDYHEWAALFARVQYKIVANRQRDQLDGHEFDGEQVVWIDRASELPHPRTGQALKPRFLGAEQPLAESADTDRLIALADWIADPRNPYFARTQANRVWYHLFGRGLVEPNDDFRAANPAAHPALLDALAEEFIRQKFDLKSLVRLLLNSSTYQLASPSDATNRDDVAHCARALIQPLRAEPLLDAISRVLEAPVKFEGYPNGLRAVELPDAQVGVRGFLNGPAPRFLKAFGKPDRLLNCECERNDDTTVVQAFQMLTGRLLHEMLTRPDNRLGRLLQAHTPDEAILEELYLAALCRLPTEAEAKAARLHLARSGARRAAWEDLAWSLVNAQEFLLRH